MHDLSVHLLNLPNEILFIILEKLNNMDVLYSLLDKDNQRLDIIAQQQIFTNNLNFVSISDTMLDRFCLDILPKIHCNVKSLILEPASMRRILFATNYPHLTELKLFNFNREIFSRYFTGKQLVH